MKTNIQKATTIKPVCVIIDTNVWVSTFLLKDSLGSALVYMLRMFNGYIGLPEIIESEIPKNVVNRGLSANEKIIESFRSIEIIMNKKPNYKVPSEEDMRREIKNRLKELEPLFVKIPFTLKHAKAALEKVYEELAPNSSKNQQFKDSAIWEAILELSTRYLTYFVTKDKGFFENRNPAQGLAPNLIEDMRKIDALINVYYDLDKCMEDLQKNVPELDYTEIATKIAEEIKDKVEEISTRTGFSLDSIKGHSLSAFNTEIFDNIAISFKLTFKIYDIAVENYSERNNARVTATGDCLFDINKKIVKNVKYDIIEFKWVDSEGEVITKRNFFVNLSMGAGKYTEYKLRSPISKSGNVL